MADTGLPVLAGGIIFDTLALIASDLVTLPGPSAANQWGLFQDGEPIVTADNVLAFEFKQEFRSSNFPVEEGSFATYNKVQTPYDVRLQFSTGGSLSDRQAMQESIDAIIGSTDLFDAVTPEKTYTNVNPLRQRLRRTSRTGLGLMVIEVDCEEVRVTATQQFSSSTISGGANGDGTTTEILIRSPNSSSTGINNPQSPDASPIVSGGTVQTTTPTAAEQASFSMPEDL